MTRPSERPRYPWSRWMDGQPHVLRPGQDFESSTLESMRVMVLSHARRNDVYAYAYVQDGALHIQFFDSLEQKKEASPKRDRYKDGTFKGTWTPHPMQARCTYEGCGKPLNPRAEARGTTCYIRVPGSRTEFYYPHEETPTPPTEKDDR